MRILVADDEKFIRKGIVTILTKSNINNIQLYEAKNGIEMLDIISNNKIDLVISDIKMPKMTGIQFLKELEEFTYKPEVILLSGYGDFQYAKEAIKYGVRAYLLKPLKKEELLTEVIKVKKERFMGDFYEIPNQKIKKLSTLIYYEDATKAINTINEIFNKEAIEQYDIYFFEKVIQLIESEVLKDLLNNLPIEHSMRDKYERLASINNYYNLSLYREDLISFIKEIIPAIKALKEEQSKFEKIDIAIKFVQENYSNKDLNMSMVSNHVSLNYSYFSQLFKERTNEKFVEYLIKYRVNKAKELLENTAYMIYEVSERVGYKDTKQFVKMFKNQVGVSPKEYRNRVMKNKTIYN